jgi:hypothetical protein
MAYQRSYDDELKVVNQPACVFLRSKGMYVTGDVNPSHFDEADSHLQSCWCNLTQHVIGPDRLDVHRSRCIPGRECFRDSY